MSTVTVTRTIDANPALVWNLVTDLPGRLRWLSTIDNIELLSRGPFGAGVRWRETRTMADGAQVTEEFEVSECAAPRWFAVRSPGSGAEYRTTYRLAPVKTGRHSGGTRVTIEQEGHPSGPTGRVLELVLGGLAARTAEGALWQELADLAEVAAGEQAGEQPAA